MSCSATPKHCPSQECLLSYANGCMGEAESLLIATHLAFCPHCRKLAHIGECVGGKLMTETAAVPVSDACRSKLFAALDGADTEAKPAQSHASPECFIPEPLRGYLGGAGCKSGVKQLAWEQTAAGQREYKLKLTSCCQRRGADARLVMLEANSALTLPATQHRRALLVLCGSLANAEATYQTGDITCAVAPDGMKAGTENCFALLVTTPPKSWLHKFLRKISCG